MTHRSHVRAACFAVCVFFFLGRLLELGTLTTY